MLDGGLTDEIGKEDLVEVVVVDVDICRLKLTMERRDWGGRFAQTKVDLTAYEGI